MWGRLSLFTLDRWGNPRAWRLCNLLSYSSTCGRDRLHTHRTYLSVIGDWTKKNIGHPVKYTLHNFYHVSSIAGDMFMLKIIFRSSEIQMEMGILYLYLAALSTLEICDTIWISSFGRYIGDERRRPYFWEVWNPDDETETVNRAKVEVCTRTPQ